MATLVSVRIILAAGAIALLGAAAPEAEADSARAAALHALPRACAADYARLCPHPDGGTPEAASVLICLKDHMIDTSMSCRKIVRAARP